jgi:hypothetical protein
VAKEEKALHLFRKFFVTGSSSEHLPVLLCKLNLNIFNTFTKIHLDLSFGGFIGVIGTVLYCNLKRKVL